MIKQLLLIVLLILFVPIAFSQSVRDAYNLDLKIPEKNERWSWLVYTTRTSLSADSGRTVNGKYAVKILSRRRIGDPHEANFKLMRTIPLPQWGRGGVNTITIKCKNKDMENLKFSVMGINENEDLQFSDSVLITKNSWKNYSISFAQKEIKAVRIILSSDVRRLRDMQTAWVDRITISVGDKIINDIAIEDLYPKTLSELNQENVIPLTSQSNENIKKIFSGRSIPKIIGLGESSHGCQEIKDVNYQLMKTLISQFGYNIILTERAIDLSLTCDLYIRGLLPKSYEDQIKAESRVYFDDYISFFNFLSWVREYNETAEVKVRLFGCRGFLDKRTGLFEYFQNVTDKENPNLLYYLEKIANGQFQAVRDRVINDNSLKSGIDVADFDYLMFLLEKDMDMNDSSYSDDKEMWINARKIIDIYGAGDERILLNAHSSHVSKYLPFLTADMNDPTLGNYMFNRYKEDYFAISSQVGEGSSTQDEGGMFGKTMIHSLSKAPKSSFEYRGLNTEFDCFYYSVLRLPKDVTHLRMLLRSGRYLDQFYFCSIKRNFDGLVFIKSSHALSNIESFPFFYSNELSQRKQRMMEKTLKRIRNKNSSEI